MTTGNQNYKTDKSVSNSNHDAEPADPTQVDHDARRSTRFAPSKLVSELPDPLVECGCGNCLDAADPLGEPKCSVSAADVCPSPRAVTVDRAREIYVRYIGSQVNSSNTSKLERHQRETYPRILRVDQATRAISSLTTVMMSRRVRPLNESDEWIPPLKLDEMLHGDGVESRMRKAVKYQLNDRFHRYVGVKAPTESAATPHEHIYYWIFDPDNEITVDQFAPALEKHLESCPNARREDHQYDEDGVKGAITVRHDPPVTDQAPANAEAMVDDDFALTTDGGEYRPNTRGAQYLASQLAHLPLADQRGQDHKNPRRTLLEGGVLSWASNYDWFRSSRNVPALSDYS